MLRICGVLPGERGSMANAEPGCDFTCRSRICASSSMGARQAKRRERLVTTAIRQASRGTWRALPLRSVMSMLPLRACSGE